MNKLKTYIPFLILLLGFLATELLIWPFGEFALNDDFAYARAVYVWDKTGIFTIGAWPAMSLFSHALLGLGFVKLFGFSYTILRISNMAFCLVTLLFVYRFFLRKNSASISALVCAFMFFNPYYLNLFNSYMTDLTFLNYSFLAFYFFSGYCQSKKILHAILFFVFSVLAVLVRQVGIVLLLTAFVVSVLNFFQTKKHRELVIFCFLLILGFLVLYLFEKIMVGRLQPGSNYQGLFFSPSELKLENDVWLKLFNKIFRIFKFSGSLFLLVFILFLPYVKYRTYLADKKYLFGGLCVFTAALFLISDKAITGDIVINFGLGIESTVDRLYIGTNIAHGSNSFLYGLLTSLFIIGYFLFAAYLSSGKLTGFFTLSIQKQFIILFVTGYLLLIGVAESSFDRYCIVFAFFVVVYLMTDTLLHTKQTIYLSIVVGIFMGCYSVLATKDYFTAARLKKKVRTELIRSGLTNDLEINSSGEHQFWDKTLNEFDWVNWDHFNDKKYLITRGPVSGFEVFKIYTYPRFLPLGTDTFFVLKNIQK